MLLGEHEHALDEKNRLTLPSKLRGAFADGVVVSRGLDGCLLAWPVEAWRAMVARVETVDPFSADGRKIRRHYFSGASPGELDKQGRLVIPATLLAAVGITREVTVAGVSDHLEIWDRATWRQQLHEVEGSAEDVAERLAN
jgi:MraZ protein